MQAPKYVLVTALIVCLAVVLIAARGLADPWGDVDCNLAPSDPRCDVIVVNPGHGGNDTGGDAGNGPIVCRLGGEVVPCYSEGFGWLGSDHCYYGKDGGGFLPPNEYLKFCYNPATGNLDYQGVVWLASPPASLAAMIQQAISQLRVPKPVIASNPSLDKPQVVQVPVWWWVQPGLWRQHTATASLPGISITARATPTKIVWHAGDGTTTTCSGPGTPWNANNGPTAASPTCGHRYTTTSRTNPGGKYELRAAVTWNITWSGGGISGTEPPIATGSSADIEVTELRTVITR